MASWMEYFIENPGKSIENFEIFHQEVDEFLRKTAFAIESDLDESNIENGELKLDNISFFKGSDKNINQLLARILMHAYNDNIPDLTGGFVSETRKRYNVDLNKLENPEDPELQRILNIFELITGKMGKNLRENNHSRKGGTYSPYKRSSSFGDENGIVMRKLPRSLKNEIDVPKFLEPFFDSFECEKKSFKATLTHELNHCYFDRETNMYESRMNDEWVSAFNEIFAHYINWVIEGREYKNKESPLYDRSDIIVWGVKILKQKSEEINPEGKINTGIDFSRSLMTSMADSEWPYESFIRFCLLNQDKKRVNRFKGVYKEYYKTIKQFENRLDSLDESDFQGSIKHAKKEKSEYLIDQVQFKHLELYNKGDLPHPEDFWRILLIDIQKENIGPDNPSYNGLEGINKEISKFMLNILKKIKENHDLLKEEKGEFESSEIIKILNRTDQEIQEYGEKMNSILRQETL